MANDEVQLGSQAKPIVSQQQPQAYQSYQTQRPDAYNAGLPSQYTQPTRPNMYQSNAQPVSNANYPQYNAPQPTQQPPVIRPLVQPSPNMNFRPNPELTQLSTSPRNTQEITYNQPRVETRTQYNVAPVQQSNQPATQYQPVVQQQQYKPPTVMQQSYNPAPQVTQAPVIQTRPMPNMPAKAYVDDGEEDVVVSGRINTPPIASSIQLAGYQNGTQSARPIQAPRPQAVEMAKRSDSLRSLSSSPEPKFNTTSSPDQIYSPTLRQSPTQPAFERLSSPDQHLHQQQQPQRVVQFQQPPERPLHFDPNQQNRQQTIPAPRVFSPEPQTHQPPTMYQRAPIHPTTLDLGQSTIKQPAYSPVSLNNLITPTRQLAQSPGVTFRLPEETEGRNETRKRPDTLLKQQIVTPTTETFRRSPMATTPENYPRASNWFNRPRSADRRYSEYPQK